MRPYTAPYTVQTADAVADGLILVGAAVACLFVGAVMLADARVSRDKMRALVGGWFVLLAALIFAVGL